MAGHPERERKSEHGLSLLEALVVITLTALLAFLLLPLVARSSARDFDLADRSLSAAEASAAEVEFRALVSKASQQPMVAATSGNVEGRADQFAFVPALREGIACARAGGSGLIRLTIQQNGPSGRLVCESSEEHRILLAWKSGQAAFAYSVEGANWSDHWQEQVHGRTSARGGVLANTRLAPLVRFHLSLSASRSLTWLARAGAVEPERVEEAGAARGAAP